MSRIRCWLRGCVFDHPMLGPSRINWYAGRHALRCIHCGRPVGGGRS